ncbi:uncharacterized protein G2W53_010488 [Senna tora]|uniref:Uncharacterized protein n=1 Tax=Senna tora TaxID=362788 RepID=A0A834WZZ2_9FABA|nr:uncharacterized protein G2W53_010488 [Senna tora]
MTFVIKKSTQFRVMLWVPSLLMVDALCQLSHDVISGNDRMRGTGNGSARNQNKNKEQEHG